MVQKMKFLNHCVDRERAIVACSHCGSIGEIVVHFASPYTSGSLLAVCFKVDKVWCDIEQGYMILVRIDTAIH